MTNRGLISLFLAFASFLTLPAEAQGTGDVDSILERIQKKYTGSPSCRMAFVQTYTPSGFGPTAPETGRVILQPPDSIRFDYDGADGKVFTFDGKAARQFVAKDKQLVLRTLSVEERNRLPLLFLVQPEKVKAQFQIKGSKSGEGFDELLLTPKSATEPREITLAVSRDGEVKRLVILDGGGNKTAFVFTSFEGGKRRAAAEFSLLPPPGTKIITE